MSPEAIFRALLSQRCAQMLAQDTGLQLGAYGSDAGGEQLSLFGGSTPQLLSAAAQDVLHAELLPIARRLAEEQRFTREETVSCMTGQL